MVWLTEKEGVALAALALSCGSTAGAEHVVPLFMSASNAQQQGFVRIVNHSDSAGTVHIRAVDDTGHEAPALTLSLAAGAVAHFNSNDLENGNTDKGLAGSTGAGNGDWALVLDTNLDIEALAFVRTSTGFLTPIHGMALTADMTHYIPTFNPGSNSNQQSSLRLINRQSQAAEVTVHGFDDRNDRSDVVSLNIPAGNAISLTAAELEDGPRTASANGALGDGQGKWRLFVESDRPIHAMSLLEDPNGYLTNLSASRKTASELSAIVDGLDLGGPGGDPTFDITLRALEYAPTGDLPNEKIQRAMEAAKERWEVTILDGFPDQEDVQVRPLWPNRHNVDNAYHTNRLSIAVIDDLFVGYYVDPHLDEFTASTYSFNLSHDMPSGARRTSVSLVRWSASRTESLRYDWLVKIAMHEIGHAIFLNYPSRDHNEHGGLWNRTSDMWTGAAGVRTYREAAGEDTDVPMENGVHWPWHFIAATSSGGDIMETRINSHAVLGSITLAALRDYGYSTKSEAPAYAPLIFAAEDGGNIAVFECGTHGAHAR